MRPELRSFTRPSKNVIIMNLCYVDVVGNVYKIKDVALFRANDGTICRSVEREDFGRVLNNPNCMWRARNKDDLHLNDTLEVFKLEDCDSD